MIRVMLLRPDQKTVEIGDESLIEVWKADESTRIWVDFEKLEQETERSLLERTFWVHPLAVQDATRPRHPPKFERFEEQYFILLRGLDAETTDIEFGVIQIALFVGDRFMITRRSGTSQGTDWLWSQLAEHPERAAEPIDALAVRLIGRVVRRYVPLLLDLEPRIDAIEEEIFQHPRDELLSELTSYKTALKQLRRIFTYHGHVIGGLRADTGPAFGPELEHELIDVHDQIDRSQSLATLYYDLASDLVEAYLALSSHRLNQVMKVLTIFTVIFVPLSFLAGIYGMNFEYIPELKHPYGYFILLGVMLTIVSIQLVIFRRKRWL